MKKELKSMQINNKVEDLVLNLAKNSSEADGFIASGMESKMLRENFPNQFTIHSRYKNA